MKAVGIIPARLGSSRFPGKPLKKINGIPMIAHCYFRSLLCNKLDFVYVATCDKKISDYVKSIGGNVVMTSKSHERASDRVAEAMLKIEKIEKIKFDIIVMIQGDEPMIVPSMISKSLNPFKNKKINVVNLMSEIDNIKQMNDPNEIKVVIDKRNNALYFSRSPIPNNIFGMKNNVAMKQVCIIPFRRNYLLKFNRMNETHLEKLESIDMLRILENRGDVKMVKVNTKSYSVDTPSDLKFVAKRMKMDKKIYKYMKVLKS